MYTRFEDLAILNSLKGGVDTVTIILDDYAIDDKSKILAEYKGKIYTAILNNFNGYYYVDDVYGYVRDC